MGKLIFGVSFVERLSWPLAQKPNRSFIRGSTLYFTADSTGQRMPQPLPLAPVSLSARTSLDGGVVMESAYNTDNPYDEIPGGGTHHTHLLQQQQQQQQPSNLYAEISPRHDPRVARGSAEIGTPSNSRSHCKFTPATGQFLGENKN